LDFCDVQPSIHQECPSHDLMYADKGKSKVVCYSDAIWARSPSSRRSTFEYCLLIGGNLISWATRSRRQF